MSGSINSLNIKYLIPGGATVNSEKVFTLNIDAEKFNFTFFNGFLCPVYDQEDFMRMFSVQYTLYHKPNHYVLANKVSGQLASQYEKFIRLLSAQDSGVNTKGQITDPEKFASLNCLPAQVNNQNKRFKVTNLENKPKTTKALSTALDSLRIWYEKFTDLNLKDVVQDEMSTADDLHLLDDQTRNLGHNETENAQKSEDTSFLDDITRYMDHVETESLATNPAFDDLSSLDDITFNMDQGEAESEQTNVASDDLSFLDDLIRVMDRSDNVNKNENTSAHSEDPQNADNLIQQPSKLRGARQIRPNKVASDDMSFLNDLIRLMDQSDTENENTSVPSKLRGARQIRSKTVVSDDLSFLDDLIRLMDRSDTENENTIAHSEDTANADSLIQQPSKLRGARQRRANTNSWFAFCKVFGQRIEIHGLDSEHQAHLVYDYLQDKMGKTKHNFPNENLPQHVKAKVDYKFNELIKKDSIRSERGLLEYEYRKKFAGLTKKYACTWAAGCIINSKPFRVYGFASQHDAHLAYDYIQEKLGRKKVNYPNESLLESFRVKIDKMFEKFIAKNNIKLGPKQALDLDLDELTKGLDQDDLVNDGQAPDSNDNNRSLSWTAQCKINSKRFKVYGFSTEHDAHLAYDYIREKLGRKKVNYPNELLSETLRKKVDEMFEKFIAKHNIKLGPKQVLDFDIDEFTYGLDQDDLFFDGQAPDSNDSHKSLKRPRSP